MILIGLIAFPFVAVAVGVYRTLAIGGDADSAAITTGKCNTLVQSENALPNGDSEAQWLSGCAAGYNAATHPGNGSP
jgi:hypothetical protein